MTRLWVGSSLNTIYNITRFLYAWSKRAFRFFIPFFSFFYFCSRTLSFLQVCQNSLAYIMLLSYGSVLVIFVLPLGIAIYSSVSSMSVTVLGSEFSPGASTYLLTLPISMAKYFSLGENQQSFQ